MTLIVNGEPREMQPGATVALLLRELGLETKPCAVELNKTLVPMKQHDATELRDGDVVELVTLIGGG